MIAEIILIPDSELGLDAAKANARQAARALSAIGIQMREQMSLCPGKSELQKAVAAALGRSNILLVLGGMGHATHCLAKTVIAQGLRLPLEADLECQSAIRQYCARTGEPFTLEDLELAKAPQGAHVFPGQYGKLPGMVISSQRQHIILLPEAPQEIAPMLAKHVVPYLGGAAETTVTRTVRTYGADERAVRRQLGGLLDEANPVVTVQKEQGEVLVRVQARGASHQQAAELCTPALRAVVECLGDAAYGLDVDSLQSALVNKLRKKELEIAVAEAGTEGMLTRILAETDGGSDVLRHSVAADEDGVKLEKLKVPKRLLKRYGGVSEQAAVAMAVGVMERAATPIGVAVTAVSPGMKKRKKPLGLVYIAVCNAENVYVKKLIVGKGGDAQPDVVLDAALSRALNMVRLFVDYLPGRYPAAIDLDEALRGKTVTDRDDDPESGEEPRKRKGLFSRFAGNFIIRKADEPKDKVRKVIFILAVLIFLGSAGYVGLYYYERVYNEKINTELQNMFQYGEAVSGVDIEKALGDLPRGYLEQFAGLYALNPDVVGYISIEDTPVSYPVVQEEDNEYYLRRDFYAQSNQHGIPFLDYRNDIKKPSDNLVIYGHNMNDGQMFGELINYRKVEYYREHPVVDLTTVYEEGRYKIFSVYITNAYTNQGPVFDYHNFIEAKSDEDFANYVKQLTIRSLINTTVDVQPGDKLLTLSTCTYEFKDARLVVVARKIRRGEDEYVDTDGAALNPRPLMPDIWYKTFGGSKPEEHEYASVVTLPTVNRASSSPSALSSAGSSSSGEVSQFVAPSSQQSSASSSAPASSVPASSVPVSSVPASSTAPSSSSSAQPPPPPVPSPAPPTASPPSSSREESSSEDDDGIPNFEVDDGGSGNSGGLELDPDDPDGDDYANEPGLFDNFSVSYRTQLSANADRLDLGDAGAGEDDSEGFAPDYDYESDTLSVYAGGSLVSGDALDIVSRMVQAEMGAPFHEEALKAQAVAAHNFVTYHNAGGTSPSVALASKADAKVKDAVAKVIGKFIYYNNKIAFTPYHATSAGSTTSSKDVWGGSYPYLVPVDSSVDRSAKNYCASVAFSREKVEDLLSRKLGITAEGDPSAWFEVASLADGDYNGVMRVCGYTQSPRTGAKITGRVLRENVFSLRSACFTVDYEENADRFIFTTYGYGHGVGMSQTGAGLYAKEGWSYDQILAHYYPGAVVQ